MAETRLYLLTGQTGVEHGDVGNAVCKAAEEARKEEPNVPTLSWFDIKKGFEEAGYPSSAVPALWENPSPAKKRGAWIAAYNAILDEIHERSLDIALLSMHMLWYRGYNFFCPVDFPTVENGRIKPIGIVTQIDDLYDIWTRIRERKDRPGSFNIDVDFSLSELGIWRGLEVLMSEKLAEFLHDQRRGFHYVWAVKHPPEMLWKLVSDPSQLTVYSAFPISRTRNCEDAVDAINEFRQKLYDEFIVFDPLTIDEYPIRAKLVEYWVEHIRNDLKTTCDINSDNLEIDFHPIGKKCTIHHKEFDIQSGCIRSNKAKIKLGDDCVFTLPEEISLPKRGEMCFDRSLRWALYPSSSEFSYKSAVDGENEPVVVPFWEVDEATKQIVSQIRVRDFQLIERSDAIIAFRPSFQKTKISDGVTKEITFAKELIQWMLYKLEWAVIWDKEDGEIATSAAVLGSEASSLYEQIPCYSTVDECIKAFKEIQQRKKDFFRDSTDPGKLRDKLIEWYKARIAIS
ncbi:MAG: hypothetical protein ACFFFC_08650 [Candidatus Thorarchaeota archaeon]